MERGSYQPERLKTVMSRVARDYVDTINFAGLVHAELISLDPLIFRLDNNIELRQEWLVVPKYRRFTEEEIGHLFVFACNHGGQVYYYLYEASYPQGSNGRPYHWEGYLEEATLYGTCSCGGTVVVTHGDIIDCRHDDGIKKPKD